MSFEDFHRIQQDQAILAELPLAVARALEKRDWPTVKELSLRAEALKEEVAGEAKRFETAREVYGRRPAAATGSRRRRPEVRL